MAKPFSYAEKLERFKEQTLYPRLAVADREFIDRLASRYRFTFQELRRVAEAARDLEMWCEEPLETWWRTAEEETDAEGRERKRAVLKRLDNDLDRLVRAEKAYPSPPLTGAVRRPIRLVKSDAPRQIFARCAAYSEKTVCCGLHTIDTVMGCAFGCSYCTIQTFYPETAELVTDLAGKLGRIELDPDRFYHIGTGQASDSLLWGNRNGLLDTLLDFAVRHPNILLELKTKSDNIEDLLERDLPANLVCSWTLNTGTVIENEEHGTASLDRRLSAARALADSGCRVAFHFHPMVLHYGWRREYVAIAERLVADFSPPEVAFVSVGSMTFIKPVVREIRRRGGGTKVLQMDMVEDPNGKLTYRDEVKTELYSCLFEAFRPWRAGVFFYLCMETEPVWRAVFGRSYSTEKSFEEDFARRCGSLSADAAQALAKGRSEA